MIRFQIIERIGANLHKTLVDAMRAGELRAFRGNKARAEDATQEPVIPWLDSAQRVLVGGGDGRLFGQSDES